LYIEAAKADFNQPDSPTRAGTLATCDLVISHILRLLHPFAPFLTDELWVQLGFGPETIQFAAWPAKVVTGCQVEKARQATQIYQTLEKGRILRGEFNLPTSQKLHFLLRPTGPFPEAERIVLASLLHASELQLIDVVPAKCPMAFTPLGELYLSLKGVLDPVAELARLTKEIEKAEKDLTLHEAKLNNPDMLAKAPAEKVQLWREQAEETRAKIAKFKNQRDTLT
jgi:valyl-tRNA synthetase